MNNELYHFTCANAYIENFSARRISDLLRDMYAREAADKTNFDVYIYNALSCYTL